MTHTDTNLLKILVQNHFNIKASQLENFLIYGISNPNVWALYIIDKLGIGPHDGLPSRVAGTNSTRECPISIAKRTVLNLQGWEEWQH